ncbi:MAG: Abi family protein [Coriobacteriia bacterium]|nr:Abi family protein [Coriobacteriia bacterium]
MKYEKPWKSIEEQAELLTSKGLVCSDKVALERALREIGYYRLSAYWFPYKVLDADGSAHFRDNTTLEMVLRSYEFDRRLRMLMFDAIGKIELEELLSEFDDIPADKLGFFDGWGESDPWARLMQTNTGTDGFAQ